MRNNKGLTLIELLVAVAIIAVLLLITLSLYRSQMQRGRDGRRKADLAKIQKIFEDYLNDHICYPECYPDSTECSVDLSSYISEIPRDPINSGNNIYFYSVSGANSCKKWYKIFTTLEYNKDPIIKKIGCIPTTCGPYNYVVSSPNVETTKRQLGEIYPWGEPSPTPTSAPTLTPTPTSGPTPTNTPTSTPTPTSSGPTPTSTPSTPTPTPIPPCPSGWHTCIDQGGKCNIIPSYLPGAVCSSTCNAGSGPCSAISCSSSCI